MRSIKIQELTVEKFAKYGAYADMLHPNGKVLGERPCEFYRDMVLGTIPGENVGFSITRAYPRKKIVAIAEYHDYTGEVMMPLDGDVLIHVAPACGHDEVPYDEFEVYRVPQGTLVALRPGTWHHGPFCVEDRAVNTLIILPERTYANDCVAVEFPEEKKLQIQE